MIYQLESKDGLHTEMDGFDHPFTNAIWCKFLFVFILNVAVSSIEIIEREFNKLFPTTNSLWDRFQSLPNSPMISSRAFLLY